MSAGKLAACLAGGFLVGWLLELVFYKLQAFQVINYAERLNKAYANR